MIATCAELAVGMALMGLGLGIMLTALLTYALERRRWGSGPSGGDDGGPGEPPPRSPDSGWSATPAPERRKHFAGHQLGDRPRNGNSDGPLTP